MGKQLFGIFLIVISYASFQAHAANVVIGAPPDGEGNSNNTIFFNNLLNRYQQLYEADAFGGHSGYIDKISFRPDNPLGGSFSESIQLEVRLSHTVRAVGGPSSTRFSNIYAENIGSDETLVLSGLIELSSDGTGKFDITLKLDEPFYYDGNSNLLLDMVRPQIPRPSTTVFDSVSLPSPYSNDTARLSGSSQLDYGYRDTIGFVTEFHFIPPDSDGDGVNDELDFCPNSYTTETVVIRGCDSSVINVVDETGCTVADKTNYCEEAAKNHEQFVSCVAALAETLTEEYVIHPWGKSSLVKCSANNCLE